MLYNRVRLVWIFLLLCCSFNTCAHADVNVRDFGAKGDGKTDDSESIQAAIDHAETEGSIVIIPKGKYIVDYIHIKASLRGEKGETVLKKKRGTGTSIYEFC